MSSKIFLNNQRKFAFAFAQYERTSILPGIECGYASREGNDVMLDFTLSGPNIFTKKFLLLCRKVVTFAELMWSRIAIVGTKYLFQ